MTRAASILGEKNRSNTGLWAGRGLNFLKENGTLGRQAERNATMKSRPSEKPAKKKTKSTTAAKSAKKINEKVGRSLCQERSRCEKGQNGSQENNTDQSSRQETPSGACRSKNGGPPPLLHQSPSLLRFPPPQASDQGTRRGIVTARGISGLCEARSDRTGWEHPSRLGNVDW